MLCVLVSLARFLPLRSPVDCFFCAVLLAATWGGPLDLYRHDWIDDVAHFVVPAAAGAALYEAIGASGSRSGHAELNRTCAVTIALAFSLAAATAWELYEWGASRAIAGSTIHVGYSDTMGDLSFGGLGGAALCVVVLGLPRIRGSLPRRRAVD
jgi:hypothetical protein